MRWYRLAPRARAVLGLLAAFALWSGFDLFQTRSSAVEEGNRLLREGKLKEALAAYQRAAKQLPDEPGVQYNLGIAHYKLGQYEKARDALAAASLAQGRELRSKAFYNLGNAQFELKKYKEAAAAYTRTLQLDPAHTAARWNLELALRRLQEEEKKKQQDQKQDPKQQKQDQKQDPKQQKQDQKQDPKQGADQKRPADKKEKKDPAEEKKQAQNKQQQKQQPQPKQGAKAGQKPPEMDNVLDALDRNDRNLQRRRARTQVGGGLPRPSKDW